jgi:hypothetical protein
MSEAWEGRKCGPLSEDHKRKISKALKGMNAKKIILYHDNNYIDTFDSIHSCADYVGLHHNTVGICLNHERRNRQGYTFKYAEELNETI